MGDAHTESSVGRTSSLSTQPCIGIVTSVTQVCTFIVMIVSKTCNMHTMVIIAAA
jgi:hypothetical protein